MCSSGRGASTDVDGRKISVNWGSVCYPTFSDIQHRSVGIVVTNWLIFIPPPPPPPPPFHHPKRDFYAANVQYDLMESPCDLELRPKLDIGDFEITICMFRCLLRRETRRLNHVASVIRSQGIEKSPKQASQMIHGMAAGSVNTLESHF